MLFCDLLSQPCFFFSSPPLSSYQFKYANVNLKGKMKERKCGGEQQKGKRSKNEENKQESLKNPYWKMKKV